jgi:serine/threonine protein kinase
VDVIGESAASIVYLAFDHSLHRHVALREYLPRGIAARDVDLSLRPKSKEDYMAFQTGLRGFINEALLLSRLQLPSLIQIRRYWEANNTAYAVMPLYEGMTLQQAFAERRITINEEWIRALILHLLNAVEAVHRAQSCHGNISPANILVREDGPPLLMEIDAAQLVIAETLGKESGTLVRGFAPIELYPEMAGAQQGAWTDIYSIAAVAYYLIACKAPPPAMQRIVDDTLRPAREIGGGAYSGALLAALDSALSVRPEQRIQTVNAMRMVLSAQGKGAESPASRATHGREAIRSHRESLATQTQARQATATAALEPHKPHKPHKSGTETEPDWRLPASQQKNTFPGTSRSRKSALIASGVVLVAGVALGLAVGGGHLFDSDDSEDNNNIATVATAEQRQADTPASTPSVAPAAEIPPFGSPLPAPVARNETAPAPSSPTAEAPAPAVGRFGESPVIPPQAAITAPPRQTTPPKAAATPEKTVPAEPSQEEQSKAKEAERLVAAEREQWRVASAIDQIASYEAYLGRYPTGANHVAARQRLAELRLRAKSQPDLAAAQRSQSKAPDSPAADRSASSTSSSTSARTAGSKNAASDAQASPAPTSTPATADSRTRTPAPAADAQVASRTERSTSQSTLPSRPSASTPASPATEPAGIPDTASVTGRKTYRHADQTMTGDFTADPSTGLVSGKGQIVWNNGDRFDGTLVKGSKEGKGQFVWSNGQRYNGDWARNEPNGRGTLVFANGNRYEGDIRNGLPDGRGVLVFSDGSRYEGQIRNGVPNGRGVQVFADGTRYEGDVRDGLPHGQGVTRFRNGDVYVGSVARGRSSGQGRLTWANGAVWEGEFRDGQRTANGRLLAASGDTSASGASQAATSESGAAGDENTRR